MNQQADPWSADFGEWLRRFEQGDESAAEEIVNAFYQRLVRLAQKRLSGLPPQVADDEGAVISALRSFFSGIQDGQFSRVRCENDLWNILATITARKAIRQMRAHWKLSGERDRVDRALAVKTLLTSDPTPEDEAMLVEECRHRLETLGDDTLQNIAQLKLQGCSNEDVAGRLGIHVRSVQRKIKLIEALWMESESD